ncbi:MAG: hypothetical protein LKF41_03235 [Bifidobacterium sp.]|jgi:hypothetical protein|nr:hypothetical protein [Bifidobacterium sp.]
MSVLRFDSGVRVSHKWRALRKIIAALTVAGLLAGGAVASAATHLGNPGYDYNPYNLSAQGGGWNAGNGSGLGIIDWANGNPVYCIEAGEPTIDLNSGTWSEANDSDSRIAANLVDRNKNDLSDFTQAAVAYALHAHLDVGSRWLVLRAHYGGAVTLEGGDINAVVARGDQLWAEATSSVSSVVDASYQYTQAKRKGIVDPGIKNASHQYVSGLSFTITDLNNAVYFDSTGTPTFSGTTNGSAQHIAWTATSNGAANFRIRYQVAKGAKLDSSVQDLFQPSHTESQDGFITFAVQRDFQPIVSTQVSDTTLDTGAMVTDRVSSGVVPGDEWAAGVSVSAQGWYFTGVAANILKKIAQTGSVSDPESTGHYLDRLKGLGYSPVAKTSVSFNGSGQTKNVTAQKLDGLGNWVVPESQAGQFGTWVWLIDKEVQSEPDYITKDYIHEFGIPAETAAHRRPIAHDSIVLEQYSGLDRDIMDTVTIGCLPEDYGTFNGSGSYGFDKDADATIRVWWAGSATGVKSEDEAYKPTSAAEPVADAHHKLIGEWTVPALNGVYKIGGGKITLQENGSSSVQTVSNTVNIIADDTSETGYYVFIYDFPGSARAPAFRSAYNDPWERTFVEAVPPSLPSISTNVTKSEVAQGESFADVAKITGPLAAGSYVTFTAFNATKGNPSVGAAKLLDEVRVNVTAEQILTSQSKPIEVTSPSTSTDKTGNVYWKVSLWNPAGELLDSHELGIESETVTVRGISVTTLVSNESAYVNEKFSDTATIEGKLSRGSYALFDAYNPVSGKPDTSVGKLLDSARVNIADAQIDASSWSTSFTITSPEISTPNAGNVYWKASVYRADGLLLATHELGIAGESVKVHMPTIETQVSRSISKPDEQFKDTATITGQVPKGSYVTFTAYNAVQSDPDINAAKLLDEVRVDIADAQAIDSATKPIIVTSPKTSTDTAGSVFWQASLHTADGTVVASHELGLPSETVHIAPGGIVTSNAQRFGAVGEQLYDEITVYDESLQSESPDNREHQGEGNSNDGGTLGHIPQGSTVTVSAYRQGDDNNGNSGIYKLGSKTITLDTNLFEALKTGQTGNRPGKLTLKITDSSFKLDKAGMVFWQTELRTAQGGVLDKHDYGEWNTDHETGYTSFERTPVQKFDTTVSKQWLSSNESSYEDSTLQVYDVLHQTSYEPYDKHGYTNGQSAQTPDGAKVSFDIWSRDGARKGTRIAQFRDLDLPKFSKLSKGDNPDSKHPFVGTDDLDNYQNVKSETWPIPSYWDASKYYYRAKVTVPTVTPGKGTDSSNRNMDIVWYGGNAGIYTQSGAQTITYGSVEDGWDPEEAFDVIQASTLSSEALWLDNMHVSDQITLRGNIPENMEYEVEVWRTDKHDGTAIAKVNTTGRLPVPASAIGSHLGGVTFRSKMLNAPVVGSYQHRLKIWTPEQPHQGNTLGTGGDTAMSAAAGLITPTSIAQANRTSLSSDKQAGDYWQQANATQKGNGDGYADRWLLFDGKSVDTERFEIVTLTTSVKGTDHVHTSKGESYVDVTNSVDVRDHLAIDGYMLAGYQVGFNLYRQVGDNKADDVLVHTINPVVLSEAQTALDSALVSITDPAEYYWQWVFTKPDGTAFQPDNANPAKSDQRITAESFHAVRVTTSTYKWAAKGGKITDTARIEGVLPENATIRFELHDWASKAKADETAAVTLKVLGFNAGLVDQEVTGPELAVPDATDWYWVEVLELPDDDMSTPLHNGGDRLKPESVRAIDAHTDVSAEFTLGTAVSDHADLTNIKWQQSGDIRDDLTTGLQARWLLWRQGEGNANTDTKISTSGYVPLSSGQVEALSPTVTPEEVGIYYWQIEISDPSNNRRIVKLGEARDPRESFRIIDVSTTAQVMQQVGKPLQDTVTITGPVLEGTLLSWELYRRGTPTTTEDLAESEETEPSIQPLAVEADGEDTLVASFATPETGAHLLTETEAKTASKEGKVMVTGPEALADEVGEYYWVASLTAPVKDLEGSGGPKLPTDANDTSHLEDTPFWTDRVRVLKETTQVVDAVTQTQSFGHTGEEFHDTVLFEGHILQGTQVDATLYRQTNGDDANTDVKVLTTKPVILADGQSSVDLEAVSVAMPGRYYWREHVYAPSNHTLPDDPDGNDPDAQIPVNDQPFVTGKPRLENESISVVRVTTTTNRVMALGEAIHDTAHIEGDVPQDARIIFQLWQQSDGNDASKDSLIFTTDVVVLNAGETQIDSAPFIPKEIATYYWTESIYPPSNPDNPVEPCVPDVSDNPNPCESALHTEPPRSSEESVDMIKVTTKAQPQAHANAPMHDTALITGQVPDGYELAFEYWQQSDSNPPSKDVLISTTPAIPVETGTQHIESPSVTTSEVGTYYWRERLVERSTGRLVHYGEARLASETTEVNELANTGSTVSSALWLTALLALFGMALVSCSRGLKQHTHRHGRHMA